MTQHETPITWTSGEALAIGQQPAADKEPGTLIYRGPGVEVQFLGSGDVLVDGKPVETVREVGTAMRRYHEALVANYSA